MQRSSRSCPGEDRGQPDLGSSVVRALIAIAFVSALSACGHREERASDRRLKDALDRLRSDRSGDPAERVVRLAAVRQIHPETPEGDAAWTACVTAYTDLSIAEESITRAETEMRTAKATGMGVSPLVLKEVVDAEERLEKAKTEMPACDDAAAKLALSVR